MDSRAEEKRKKEKKRKKERKKEKKKERERKEKVFTSCFILGNYSLSNGYDVQEKLTHKLLIILDLVKYLGDFRSNRYVNERIGILIRKNNWTKMIKSIGYLSSASS